MAGRKLTENEISVYMRMPKSFHKILQAYSLYNKRPLTQMIMELLMIGVAETQGNPAKLTEKITRMAKGETPYEA